MQVDHVTLLVADADAAAAELRRHGLGSERGPYQDFAGTRSHMVPLAPPAYLEFLTIENREAAEATESGKHALACEAAGVPLLGWAVLADDLEAVAERLGIAIHDYTRPHGDGTLRGFRSVSGSPHLPFFIDYPNNGDRDGRLRAIYERVGHTSAPTAFAELTISGSERELADWIGPHNLPLRVVEDGPSGLRAARIATANGLVTVPWAKHG